MQCEYKLQVQRRLLEGVGTALRPPSRRRLEPIELSDDERVDQEPKEVLEFIGPTQSLPVQPPALLELARKASQAATVVLAARTRAGQRRLVQCQIY